MHAWATFRIADISLTLLVMIVPSCGLVSVRPTRCGASRPFSRIKRARGQCAEEPSSFIGQHDMTGLARLALSDRHHARVGIEIGGTQSGKLRIPATGEQCTANEVAECGFDDLPAAGENQTPVDQHYVRLREELNRTFETIGLAPA